MFLVLYSQLKMDRRTFLIAPALAALPLRAAAYKVAVTYGTDAYQTAARAITASGEFPNVAGKTVVIKPNLVVAMSSSTGCTTDPQVVRAVVDACLAGGAAQVIIGESPGLASGTVPFAACGYNAVFNSYDPRVSLLDFGQDGTALVPVQNGYVYQQLILPALAADPQTVWVSVAKMKVHVLSKVTLGLKNSFGLFLSSVYGQPPTPGTLPRIDPHFRGMDQSIVDLHLARPMDFTIIDGIVGMETSGPTNGTPIASQCVVVGKNTLACDRVAMKLMGQVAGSSVHLSLASLKGIGPATVEEVELAGDPFVVVPYAPAGVVIPHTLWPVAFPPSFPVGGSTTVTFQTYAASFCRLEVYRDDDLAPGAVPVRTLMDWQFRSPGTGLFVWDGRDDAGAFAAPGQYMVRMRTKYQMVFPVSAENTASSRVNVS